ncbi:MAG TPA: class II fructose-bisphosphatase [Spirochaetota bacterium]|nr:class II fructose-bisphosphatase [Spirochaetota bacterium]
MDRNLALEVVRVTEAAALYASRQMGRGNEELANRSAIDAMAKVFTSVSIKGRIVISPDNEGSLVMGTEVGTMNGIEVDIALDPLEGKTTCANGGQNSITTIAIGERSCFFKAPPVYMEKIAVGADAKGVIDITQSPQVNIKRIARALGKYIEDITVCVLDRERHKGLIDQIRGTGARIKLIQDGDISGAVAAAMSDKPIDVLMGVGGAMHGVLAASALKCLSGDIQARFVYRNDEERELVKNAGVTDLDRIYSINDLAMGDNIMFSATGVTDGELLPGVRYYPGGAHTSSVIMRSKTHTIRYIAAEHHFDYKPMY